jgi:hypothetical protein
MASTRPVATALYVLAGTAVTGVNVKENLADESPSNVQLPSEPVHPEIPPMETSGSGIVD